MRAHLMRILERLWLRLTFRRRPRLRAQWRGKAATYAGLTPTQVVWVDAIRPLFDERYYLHTHPEVRHTELSAAAHYVSEGHGKGFDPAPWFCEAGYLDTYPDVAAAGLPAFVHYAIYGRAEGRLVTPTADVRHPPARDQST